MKRALKILLVMVFSFSWALPAFGIKVLDRPVENIPLKGPFTLLLYGGSYPEDPERVAILDLEGDEYRIVPFSAEFDYTTIEGLTLDQALSKAKAFLSENPYQYGTEFWGVFLENGKTIGYEIRPLYDPFRYGFPDVLDLNYWLKGKTVFVNVKNFPEIERPPLLRLFRFP